MVYETKTLKPCHPFTAIGKKRYQDMLEDAADEILFRHEHPFMWAVGKMLELL